MLDGCSIRVDGFFKLIRHHLDDNRVLRSEQLGAQFSNAFLARHNSERMSKSIDRLNTEKPVSGFNKKNAPKNLGLKGEGKSSDVASTILRFPGFVNRRCTSGFSGPRLCAKPLRKAKWQSD